jgi:hypothetical protein
VILQLKDELAQFHLNSVSLLIAGLDDSGPHIYLVEDDNIKCYDTYGYAAIGSGAFHARSQFINSNHSPADPAQTALYTVYLAKKRAEAAPGVGEHTDDRYIYALGQTVNFREEIMEVLRTSYAAAEAETLRQNVTTYAAVRERIDAIINPPPEATPAAQAPPQPIPTAVGVVQGNSAG